MSEKKEAALKAVSALLGFYRRRQGKYSQLELDEAAGLPHNSLGMYESGNRLPGEAPLRAIGKALDLAPDSISELVTITSSFSVSDFEIVSRDVLEGALIFVRGMHEECACPTSILPKEIWIATRGALLLQEDVRGMLAGWARNIPVTIFLNPDVVSPADLMKMLEAEGVRPKFVVLPPLAFVQEFIIYDPGRDRMAGRMVVQTHDGLPKGTYAWSLVQTHRAFELLQVMALK